MASNSKKETQKLADFLGSGDDLLEQTPSQVIEEHKLQKAAMTKLRESGAKDEVGFLVAEFLRTHPDFVPTCKTSQHPAVLQMGTLVNRWLHQCYGENITTYYLALMRSAEIWFEGCPDSLEYEWRAFRNTFEGGCCVGSYYDAGVFEIYSRIRAKWRAKTNAHAGDPSS